MFASRKAQELSGRLFLSVLLRDTVRSMQGVIVSYGKESCTVGLLDFGQEEMVYYKDHDSIKAYGSDEEEKGNFV